MERKRRVVSPPDSPFVRDSNNRLVRRSYWLDMDDRTLVLVMTKGIGAHLINDEKRAHLADLDRERLIDQICISRDFAAGIRNSAADFLYRFFL